MSVTLPLIYYYPLSKNDISFIFIELYVANTRPVILYTGLSKKMDGIWNRYNLKSTGRIYTFGVLKYSVKFKVLDLL